MIFFIIIISGLTWHVSQCWSLLSVQANVMFHAYFSQNEFLILRVNLFGSAGNKRFKSIYLHNKDALENTGIKYQ